MPGKAYIARPSRQRRAWYVPNGRAQGSRVRPFAHHRRDVQPGDSQASEQHLGQRRTFGRDCIGLPGQLRVLQFASVSEERGNLVSDEAPRRWLHPADGLVERPILVRLVQHRTGVHPYKYVNCSEADQEKTPLGHA
jgi:hypothetical protein